MHLARYFDNGSRSEPATLAPLTHSAPVFGFHVGAGGHFCPVARQLNGRDQQEGVVVAQEIEFRLDEEMAAACPVRNECPELFFWPDLMGYGWCVRKGDYLNVGAGRLSANSFPASVREFVALLGQLPLYQRLTR